MWTPIGSGELFSEANLFTRGAMAGDLAFVAQDGRVASGEPADPSVEAQARRTLANLGIDLKTAGLDLENIVSLMVYLPGYEGAGAVAEVLANTFGENRPEFSGDQSRRHRGPRSGLPG